MEPNSTPEYIIAIAAYPGIDLMDLAAPYEIFQWMASNWNVKKVSVLVVAETLQGVTTRDGLHLSAHQTFDSVPHVDLLWIPGGDPQALVEQMKNPKYVGFIQSRSAKAEYVTSVCEGALIAANAGLFNGFEVTTHWAFTECLKSYPEIKVAPGHPRFVHCGNRVTGGGISSGIDEALYLVKLIAGEAVAEQVQVTMQYFPEPPVSGKIPAAPACPIAGQIPVKN